MLYKVLSVWLTTAFHNEYPILEIRRVWFTRFFASISMSILTRIVSLVRIPSIGQINLFKIFVCDKTKYPPKNKLLRNIVTKLWIWTNNERGYLTSAHKITLEMLTCDKSISSYIRWSEHSAFISLSTFIGASFIFTICLNRDIGPAVRVFANGPGDLGSIPGRVIPKTLKMELDTTLLNTQG